MKLFPLATVLCSLNKLLISHLILVQFSKVDISFYEENEIRRICNFPNARETSGRAQIQILLFLVPQLMHLRCMARRTCLLEGL